LAELVDAWNDRDVWTFSTPAAENIMTNIATTATMAIIHKTRVSGLEIFSANYTTSMV